MTGRVIETRINSASLDMYRAKLLDYSIGAVEYSDGYITPVAKPFPVKLTPKIGMREVSLTLDFEGDDAREIARSISSFTAALMANADIELPDGFHYWCVYDSATPQVRVAPWIDQVTFYLHGLRHEEIVTQHFAASGKMAVEGNMKTPAIVKLTPRSGASSMSFNGITVNSSSVVTIDGVYTTVLDANGNNVFGDTDMTEWPKLDPGDNTIALSGCTAEISYYPIYV